MLIAYISDALCFQLEKIWKKIGKKNLKISEKILEKKFEKYREIFFFDFPKKISVEIFHMVSRLRMQSFMIISQGVPAVEVVTDKQTNFDDVFAFREILRFFC